MTTSRSILAFLVAFALTAPAWPALAQDEVASEPLIHPTEDLTVKLDLATLVKAPPETTMIVIGNPAIADATLLPNGLINITGKGYGLTNLLAVDPSGATLREIRIKVAGERANMLTVLRGVQRETYSCAPRCEQTVTLGDAPEYFGATTGQIGGRNGLASGAAAAPAAPASAPH